MLNIIHADVYRLLRGKAIYITLIVLAAFVALNVASGMTTIGLNRSLTEELYQSTNETIMTEGLKTAETIVSNSDSLIFFLMPLFIGVCATMFTHGTVKNKLSAGVSRVTLYFSKLLLSAVLCLLLILAYVLFGMITAVVLRGFGGLPPWEATSDMVKSLAAQLVILLAFSSVGVFLSFSTRRAAAVNGAYIAFILVPSIIVNILSSFSNTITEYLKYDLYGCLMSFIYIDRLSSPDILRGILVGAVYILASTLAGIAIFRKCEIK